MIQSIIVVGASGAGKTTLVNSVRQTQWANSLIIPKRYITRPQRQGDDLDENQHLTKEQFLSMVEEGKITPSWERELEEGRIEQYGFEAVDPNDARLRIYSANNAFLRDLNESVKKTLTSSVVVLVQTQAETKQERLQERSPDMKKSEFLVRTSDMSTDIINGYTGRLITIDTTELTDEQGAQKFQDEIQKILRENLEHSTERRHETRRGR